MSSMRFCAKNPAHRGKANVAGPKRATLGDLSNKYNRVQQEQTQDEFYFMMSMLQMTIPVPWTLQLWGNEPFVDHLNVDFSRVVPRLTDMVRDKRSSCRMRQAGHCVRHPKLVASKLTVREPNQRAPRRGKRRATYVDTLQHVSRANTAELLMLDRKERRAAILESRRTGAADVSMMEAEPADVSMKEAEPADVSMKEAEPADVSMKEAEPADVSMKEAFSDPLLTVEDIDAGDSDVLQLCSEYVKDIYAYLMDLEVQQAVRPGYMKGYDITPRMRALLINWLIKVHSRFQLLQETLYRTVAILDRFLQVQPVSREELQLVGVTAMLLASKYEENRQIDVPEVQDFADITDNTFTTAQIREMEKVMLRCLNFELGRPLPLQFLRRASKAANSTVERHMLAKYLMELTLLDYDLVHYRPSEIAAAALCLSQLLLDGLPWTATEQYYTTYDEAHLKPIMQHLAKNVLAVNEGKTKFQAVKRKYSGSKLLNVTILPELQSSTVKSLAASLLDHP